MANGNRVRSTLSGRSRSLIGVDGSGRMRLCCACRVISRSNRRSEHAQSSRSDLKVERRPHGCDFAIERNEQPAPACADIGSRALEDAKIALAPDMPENATACEPEHQNPALSLGDEKTQPASIEPLPRAKRRSRNTILLVSDEHARAAARLNSP